MASEAVDGKEMIHEISALSRRTVKMKICGLTVGGIGLLAAIVGIGVFLSSFLIGPSATGFKIDIPDALIPLQGGGHEAFGSIADAVGEGIAGISSKIFGLSVAVALVYTPFKVFRAGFNPSSLVPLFSIIIFGTTFKLLPSMLGVGEGVGQGLSSTISATSKVTKLVENDETGKLLEYLKSANSGSSDKMPLINYVWWRRSALKTVRPILT
ncbi:hypothetical protein J6187_003786 [Salmonella enterica]|nr:hypothetical protein [Salmonella enterica]EHG9741808.1 hypothetical protein [Salmonella enterica]